MLLTLNQVISQITTLAAAHSQIAASGVGDFAEWQAEERNYPLLWVFHETTNVGNRELVYSIRLICADRVITGEEGEDTDGMEQEVLSDTLLILLDFLAYFQQQHSQTYTVVPSATIDPFTERFNDRVAGNSMVIQIRQPFTWDACQIPQSGATIPPTVDGLTLYDFCDQSVIDRLTADQVACLEAEYALPCSPVTQQVNGTTIGTTASGGTNNQLIRNTAGTAVGTSANPSVIANTTIRNSAVPTWSDVVVSGVTKTLAQGKALDSDGATTLLADYIPTTDGFMFTCTPSPPCADATVTINGASLGATGDIPSGVSEDLDVLQGGSAVGSWNGSAWIIPTCPAAASLAVTLSNASRNFNDSLTITSTPTNFTPTNHIFYALGAQGITELADQASGVYVWTVNQLDAQDIYVVAEDGLGNKVWNVATVTVSSETDAAAFITATSITDYDQRIALNILVVGYKAAGIWTSRRAIYPIIGGSATTHKYNLKNPLDTDAAYRLLFSGGWTHSATGALPNGTNAYANTYVNPLSHLTSNSMAISYYSRTPLNTALDQIDIGVISGGVFLYLSTQYNASGLVNRFFSRNASGILACDTLNDVAQGFYQSSKTSNAAGAFKTWKDGVLQDTETGAGTNPNANIFLGAANNGGAAAFYTNRECCFASIGDGLTDAQALAEYNLVQAFQIALIRQR